MPPAQHALIRADRALVFAFEANRLREQELVGNGAVAVREGQMDAAAQLFEQARRWRRTTPRPRPA